jgi:hypothetical protein
MADKAAATNRSKIVEPYSNAKFFKLADGTYLDVTRIVKLTPRDPSFFNALLEHGAVVELRKADAERIIELFIAPHSI